MPLNVLMTATSLARPGVDLLAQAGCSVSYLMHGKSVAEIEAALKATPFDAIISRSLPLSRKTIESAPSLKVIARHGIGFNNVDLDAASERGIPVLIADGANAQSVAELTVGLLFAVARRIPELDRGVRRGEWDRSTNGLQLAGRTAGLIAYGTIGRAVSGMLRSIGMTVVVYDPYMKQRPDDSVRVADSLDDLLAMSDVVSLHCPLTTQTQGMIGAGQLARMKPGAILLNTARGGLIDEVAVAQAVQSGHLAGAGLDTFADEPLPDHHPFRAIESIVMTPHMGGSTDAALDQVAISAAQNLIDVLIHGRINHRLLVNPAVLERTTLQAAE